ncbi:hypothetical protein AI2942V1_5241 [Klebsiella pneumoniae]|nr:hypothetical protein AI2686V1_4549 [Klebsiella pneumoniae]CAE7129109.1 hypothetical protein AI2681V1_4596 [Klebsiella pneumoniae]CAE7131523.1 hypothetical protein AI2681V1_4726 [Klebsiella pneumoniae]CAE7523437.1 hypothetical protein AI2675V1_4600 [Klebsiella pneumoniae]CAE7525430.1 hypothetical protein AI2675V1_4730 [Klebsiella pneumoniae]
MNRSQLIKIIHVAKRELRMFASEIIRAAMLNGGKP